MTSPDPPSSPRRMSMLGFVEEFANIHTTMPNRRFAFILGAGASKSSGIKLASEMVGEWVSILHRRAPDAEGQAVADWASAATLGIAEYDPRDPAASYPALYQRMYGTDPDRGYAYLENQMAQAEPSYGYSVLARIMAEHRHRVVITVNFDNLVADSLSIFSANYPLVCGHESLAPFARTDLRRPLVLKVHRDLLLNPMSTPEQLATMADGLNETITALLRQYTPIVLGYGGNDASLMACLEGLARASIPGGVYWCHREGSAEPPERICSFIARQNGHLVPVLGFDELMALLGQKLDLTRPDEIVLKRAEARAEQLKQQLDRITARMTERAAKPRPMAAIARHPRPQRQSQPQNRQGSNRSGSNRTPRTRITTRSPQTVPHRSATVTPPLAAASVSTNSMRSPTRCASPRARPNRTKPGGNGSARPPPNRTRTDATPSIARPWQQSRPRRNCSTTTPIS